MGGVLRPFFIGHGLGFHQVGLDGVHMLQKRHETLRLEGADRIHQRGHGHVFKEKGQRIRPGVGVCHAEIRLLRQQQEGGEGFRRQMLHGFHTVDGAVHVPVRVVQAQVGGGGAVKVKGVGQVHPFPAAQCFHDVGDAACAQRRQQGDLMPASGQPGGNVVPHAAGADGDTAAVGIAQNKRSVRLPQNVQIGAAQHGQMQRLHGLSSISTAASARWS